MGTIIKNTNCKYINQFVVITLMILSIFSQSVSAEKTEPHRMYGKDAAFQIIDLPKNSGLRQRLESLTKHQQKKAMRHLHNFSFPASDLDDIKVDDEGGIYYSEAIVPEAITAVQATTSTLIALPNVNAFKLHSRPKASKKVFLDFNGHTITNTVWNNKVASYSALPFDIDGNPTNFSSEERNRIAEIWHRISEDYAPFDIDVTTEQPASFGPTVGRILFTKDTDAKGVAMPSRGVAGIAYTGVWGFKNYASYYSPALVYYNKLGSGYAPYMAEAGAHEFGHNLGLSHDGVTAGNKNPKCLNATDYYCGKGQGNVSWAPIMGAGYYTNVTAWSNGEYVGANNKQDDLAIISSKLHYRTDDHGNTFAKATALLIETDGSIVVSNPQNDPNNVENFNKGIIETRNDIDAFSFDTKAGPLNITVTPAWAAFFRATNRGANLDIQVKLYDQSGKQIAVNDPSNDTNTTISTTVSKGRYYLVIAGVGNSVTQYSDYGSLGEYFISGNITP
jgi:hypothetical protein